jgi:hypothetical protein
MWLAVFVSGAVGYWDAARLVSEMLVNLYRDTYAVVKGVPSPGPGITMFARMLWGGVCEFYEFGGAELAAAAGLYAAGIAAPACNHALAIAYKPNMSMLHWLVYEANWTAGWWESRFNEPLTTYVAPRGSTPYSYIADEFYVVVDIGNHSLIGLHPVPLYEGLSTYVLHGWFYTQQSPDKPVYLHCVEHRPVVAVLVFPGAPQTRHHWLAVALLEDNWPVPAYANESWWRLGYETLLNATLEPFNASYTCLPKTITPEYGMEGMLCTSRVDPRDPRTPLLADAAWLYAYMAAREGLASVYGGVKPMDTLLRDTPVVYRVGRLSPYIAAARDAFLKLMEMFRHRR